MRHEVIQLGIVVHFAVFKPIVLAEGAAVIDDERWCLGDPGFRKHLDHVVVERRNGEGMLVAVEAIDDVSQVELQVQRAFRRRHHFQFFRSLHHELALLAVPDDVALDVVRAVILLVFREHALHFLHGLEVVVGENAGTGRECAQADDVAAVGQVLVSEHVVRSRLHV